MPNDAMIVAIDQIRFTYMKSKRMAVYAVAITADNTGKVMVTEPPSCSRIWHRPKKGKPAVWDFAGDGYAIYQKTGGLPDFVVSHLLIVRDKSGKREAGAIIKEIGKSDAAKQTIDLAGTALTGITIGGLSAATALGALLPVANLVGEIIAKKKDKVLQTISGSMYLDDDRKQLDELTDTVTAPDNNMEVEVDAFLFDAAADTDTEADTRNAETRLKADGLLFASDGG